MLVVSGRVDQDVVYIDNDESIQVLSEDLIHVTLEHNGSIR